MAKKKKPSVVARRKKLKKICCSVVWEEDTLRTGIIYPPTADTPNCQMVQCKRCEMYYPKAYVNLKYKCYDCQSNSMRIKDLI